ncbi:L-lactate dehydrogenase [Oenococcus alcoholitolerans]|uniref:L-lactate dehydrogenase n=1 Tax=Oenococcus alcoholitolerans TaxID=931074 RepID=UPI003F6FD9F1
MTRKIGIIGLGHVGSTVAHYLVTAGFADDLVLIDTNELKVTADAIDFSDAMSNLPSHTNLFVNDYQKLADADLIISAVGNIKLQKDNKEHDRFVELPFTSVAVKDVSSKIKESGFNGILIDITNPCDVITSLYQKYTGLPKDHVIGTGTLLDSSRMKRAVAQSLDIDPRSVDGYNLGEHGNSQFTAWSTVRVLGRPIKEIAQERAIDLIGLDDEARKGGYTVFHGKHYTNFGIAAAAVRLANVILSDAKSELPVSNFREEYGTYLSYPAIVGKNGIENQVQLVLDDEEKTKLAQSANYIKTRFEDTCEKLGK